MYLLEDVDPTTREAADSSSEVNVPLLFGLLHHHLGRLLPHDPYPINLPSIYDARSQLGQSSGGAGAIGAWDLANATGFGVEQLDNGGRGPLHLGDGHHHPRIG